MNGLLEAAERAVRSTTLQAEQAVSAVLRAEAARDKARLAYEATVVRVHEAQQVAVVWEVRAQEASKDLVRARYFAEEQA